MIPSFFKSLLTSLFQREDSSSVKKGARGILLPLFGKGGQGEISAIG
jgi:hypothetical protein